MIDPKVREILKFVLLALVYFITGKLGLMLAGANPSVTAVWAPTGIALAALLYFGKKYWPAILVAAFFVNFFTTYNITSSLMIAIGNTLEAVVGAYLINRFADGAKFFCRALNVKKFILFAIIATAFSATVGSLTLILSNFDSWSKFSLIWFNWWVGDMSGAIIVTPMLLLLFDYQITRKNRTQIYERIIFIFCVVLISIIVFGGVFKNHPLGFLLIPLLVWPGIRFSQRESAVTTFTIAAIAVVGTLYKTGPFIKAYPHDTILMLQAYLCTISMTGLILAASVAEKRASEERLSLAYDNALEGWSAALDLRDKETEGHSLRVAELCVRLGQRLGLSETDLINIKRGALLHDIGKMAIPDNILYKPGPLTADERTIMKKHPIYAGQFLSNLSYFRESKDIAYSHHERWDGSGYPEGLKGKDIPYYARIFAIVDVWDAMHSSRPYRDAYSDQEVLNHMHSRSGTHFDPEILSVFMGMITEESAPITSNSVIVQTADLKKQTVS